jgi:hypothetical protein
LKTGVDLKLTSQNFFVKFIFVLNPNLKLTRERPRSSGVTLSVATAVPGVSLDFRLRTFLEDEAAKDSLALTPVQDVSEEIVFISSPFS